MSTDDTNTKTDASKKKHSSVASAEVQRRRSTLRSAASIYCIKSNNCGIEKDSNPTCTLPMLVTQCDDKGSANKPRLCALCQRRTVHWCVGCGRAFCNSVQKDQKKYHADLGSSMMTTAPEEIVKMNLGGENQIKKTPGSPKKRKITKEKCIHFKFSCHVRAHLHLFEGRKEE